MATWASSGRVALIPMESRVREEDHRVWEKRWACSAVRCSDRPACRVEDLVGGRGPRRRTAPSSPPSPPTIHVRI
ncbi:MAG: hypothetical protein ABGY24_15350 [bacterium]